MTDSAELTALRIDRRAQPASPGGSRRRWRWPLALVGILAALLLCWALFLPPRVTVVSAARGGVAGGDPAWAELSAAGYIVADRQSTVAAKYTTRIARLLVREAAVVVEPATGAIVHAFTSGTVVQIFQLEPHGVATQVSAGVAPSAEPGG